MPKTKISEFSATPANNTDIDSINIAEGCAPSGINDAIRELMAQLKDFQTGAVGDSFNGPIGTSTAAAGAFTTLSASSTATLSGLTASTALALDASKNIVSVTNTGTGSNVLATSPTLVTPVLGVATGTSFQGIIGNVTPAAGNFTTLGASSTATLNTLASSGATLTGGTINGMTVGATTASTGAFTTLSATGVTTLQAGTVSLPALTTTGDTNTGIFFPAADNIAASTGGTERLRIDSLGNAGLGVTPSTWTNLKVLESGYSSSFGGNIASSVAYVVSNGTFNGGWLYKTTGSASYYRVDGSSGLHAWFVAPSGTAGNAITFTQAMTLDSSSNLSFRQASSTTTTVGFQNTAGTQIQRIFYNDSDGSLGIGGGTATAYPLKFFNGNTQAMTLNASGNLGIGTTSPASPLTVRSSGTSTAYAGNIGARIESNGAGYSSTLQLSNNVDASATVGLVGTSLGFGVGTTQMLTLTSAGNLGLGVTPSAWGSSYKALQTPAGSLSAFSTSQFGVNQNTYDSGVGTFLYANTAAASRYLQTGGQHSWYSAASGTAGNAITFTETMTLQVGGNLGIGTSSPAYKLDVSGVARVGGLRQSFETGLYATDGALSNYSATNGVYLNGNAAGWVRLNGDGTAASFIQIYGSSNASPNIIQFNTASTERARIDSSGNLLVGTTSSNVYGSEKLSVNSTGVGISSKVNNASNPTLVLYSNPTSGNNSFAEFFTETSATLRGSITYNRAGGLTAYNVTSDYRAKDISGPVVNSGALIDSVPVYMGKMKDATQERPMFIAHETPNYAHTGEKDAVDADGNPVYQQMDASALIPVMWAEIQSLRQRLSAANL
jgi:hypothetical protein